MNLASMTSVLDNWSIKLLLLCGENSSQLCKTSDGVQALVKEEIKKIQAAKASIELRVIILIWFFGASSLCG